MYVCHEAWKQSVKDKVFGDDPDFDSLNDDDDATEGLSLSMEFKDFPFVEEKIAVYTRHVPGAKFVKKPTIITAGKCLYQWEGGSAT
jgi:hypothetical protein